MPANPGGETASDNDRVVVIDPKEGESYPTCECGDPAVVRGLLVVNTRVYVNEPLCAGCFVPAGDLDLPENVSESILDDHTTSLITSPADEVIRNGNDVLIEHGPGDVSRLTLGGDT